ncbi:putative Ig domain-containing protein [Brevundimonas sp.]
MSVTFVRRALMLVIGLAFVLTASLATAPAAHAAPSLICPTLNASVAYGGSVSIDVSNCDGAFNFGVGGPYTLPVHGTAVLGQQSGPGIQFATYAHNGVSGTTDSFTLDDEEGGIITVNITILPPTSSLVVTPGSLPTLVAGTPLSQTITTSGGAAPYSYALDSGALPVGVILSPAGLLSGTPTHRGVYTFSVRVTDSASATTVKGYTGSVQNPSLSLASNTGTASPGVLFSQTLITNGGVAPYQYQLESGSFPAGITVSSAGVVSGTTAAAPGSYTVTLRVTDASTGPGTYFELETFTVNVAALPTVSIAVAPASVSEDGATNLTYTVTRSAASASALTVNLTTSGTATAGTDYTGNAASVTIAANATTATLVINPTADNVIESNETVILTVASGSGYTVGAPASATGTITNDDVSAGTSTLCPNLYATVAYGGSVSIDATACHAGFGLGNIATQATHGTGSVGPFGPSQFINYAHNGISGTTDTFIVRDGNSPPNNLIQVNITITPPTSSIVVAPANLPTLTAGTAFSQTLTSTGGTGPYTYSMSSGALPAGLSLSPAGVLSGTPTQRGTYTFSVQSQDSLGAVAVKGYTGTVQNPSLSLAVNSGTANQGAAYSQALVTNGGVAPYTYQLETGSFPAGITVSSAGIVSGTTAAASGNYPVTLRVTDSSTGPGSYFELETFTLTVVDLPSVSIAVAPASVSEDGATSLTYTVTRSAVSASALTVNLTTSGTATAGTDYSGAVASVTIAANATTASVVIDPTTDATVEADETVVLTVASGSGYTVGAPSSATGTILNDDVPSASIAVSPASISEDGAGNLIYTVTLSQPALSATIVNFTVGGTATSGTDYAAVASPVVIAAGSLTATITVNPTADATIEADETVILTLSAGTGYTVGSPANATGTVLNDDLPTLTINDVALNEGDTGTVTASFTVSLSSPAGPGGVTFDIATANNTATAGVDYVARNLAAQTIAAGASTYTFDVLINGDLLNEPLERFFVNVSNVSGAVVVDAQGRGTIQNDDAAPTLSINDVTLVEGNSGFSNAVFTVTLSAASAQNVTVIYASSNGTATAGTDYAAASGTLTFAPGVLTQTISPAVLGDTEVEADETFAINLSGAINATIADGAGQGTIQNDDATPVLASIAPASGPASGGTSVTLTGSELIDATGVRFGATPARSFTVNSATSIIATAPAGTGVVDVIVTTPSGTTAATAATRFTFIDAPVASGVNLTAPYNDGMGTAASLDLSTRVTGDVTSYAVGTATHGTVSATGSQVLYVPNVGYAGSDSFTFTATGPGGTSSPATVNVNVTLPSLTLTPGALANGQRGQAYSATLVAGGGVGPYTYTVTAGALPTGLTLSPDGILSGTPQASGAFNINVTATDSSTGAGPFSIVRGYGLNIGAPTIALTPAAGALPGATVGAAYSGAVSASGGIAPYSFAVTGGALPAGLTLTSNGSLTGTPTTSGAFTFAVTATDAATAGSGGPYSGSAVYSLSVGDAAPVANATSVNVVYGAGPTPVPPVLSGGPTATVAVATAPSRGTATASGATLTYTPNAGVYGTDSFTYTATGPGGTSAPATVTVTISAPTLTLSPTTLTDAQEDVAYSLSLTASGGAAPYSFAVTAGALPAGLTLAADGHLSGTPTAAGNYGFTVTATDSSTGAGPASISQIFSLTVGAPPPPVVVSPPGTIPAEGGSRGGEPVRIDLSALVSGDVTEIRIGTPPQNGTLRLETVAGPNGSLVTAIYTANAGYEGPDSFTFLAVGPGGTSAPATISLNVVGLDPTAPTLTATTEQGRPVTVDLTATATEGPFTDAAIVSITPASAATAILVPGGTVGNRTYAMTITPRADFDGVVVVTYTLSNTFGASAPATVTLTVSTRPDPSADPDVRALSTAQAQAARQFAVTQLGNFNRRNEQLHGDAGGGSAMGLSLTSGRSGLFEGPLDDLPWTQRERQLTDDREASFSELPDHLGRVDTTALGVAGAQAAVSGGGPRETGDIAFWSGGAVTVGGFDETARTSSFDVSTSGISAGADVKVSDQLTVGAGGGYGSQRTDIGETEDGRLDGETWSGAVYGSYRPTPGVFIDGVLGYGSLSFDTRRLAANSLIAQGERDGDMVMASLTAGWDREREASLFSTYGRIDYVLTTLDAYSETGAGLYNLAFDEREFESVVGALGIRGQIERQFRDSILIQTGRLEWRHEFGGLDGQALDYADIGGFRYVIDGERWMRDELAAELGLEMRYDSGLVLGVDVGGHISNGSRGATLRFLLAKRF